MSTTVNRSISVQRTRALTDSYANTLGNIDKTQIFKTWPQKSAHVITELLTTEKGYIESVEEVICGYLKPLYEYLLSASQGSKFIETVFCNLQKLYNIHLNLYISMISSYNNPSKFGQVFIKAMDNFREYVLYCTNFPKCEEFLQQVMKSEPDTRDFIIHCQIEVGHPLPLITYLHKPVQRILKYRLLLEQTIKGMSDNMQGFSEMNCALYMMSKLTSDINEVKRKNENLQRVENIQKSVKGLKSAGLCGGDLKSCGSLVFEEKCKVLGRFGGERIMMLFEKCLLFLRAKGSQRYIYKWHILIEELDVCEVSGVSNVFKIFSVYKPSQKVSVEVKTSTMKDNIVKQIQSVLVKDLKEQENIRSSKKKKEENKQTNNPCTELQEHNSIINIQDKQTVNLAYKRSLLAQELQSRRRTRQMSTRRILDTSDIVESESSEKESIHTSISSDSGLGTSITSAGNNNTTNEKEINNSEQNTMNKSEQSRDDKKLRRRTAVRRKETSRAHQIQRILMEGSSFGIEPPATISYSYPLESEQWMMGNSSEKSANSEETMNVESSLVKTTRLQDIDVESSLDRGQRTAEFIRMQPMANSNTEHYPSGPRVDKYYTPPEPSSLVLNGNYNISEYPSIEEIDQYTVNRPVTEGRVSVISRDNDIIEASLCSNVSSLSAEDHYYLSTMPSNSSVIAGMDGDNITIYDNDSDESEDDWEDEEQEQETRDDGGDMVEKSLRSYLSRAQLWGSLDEDECSISPLATLPRMSNNGSVCSLRQKPMFAQYAAVDIFQSLPPSHPTVVRNTAASSSHSTPLLTQSLSLINLPPPPADEEDILDMFVIPLPESPNDSSEYNNHRDSWIPPDYTNSAADKVTTPTIQNEGRLFDDIITPEPLMTSHENSSENRKCRNNGFVKDFDSGFQSEDLDLMTSLVNEIQSDQHLSEEIFETKQFDSCKQSINEKCYKHNGEVNHAFETKFTGDETFSKLKQECEHQRIGDNITTCKQLHAHLPVNQSTQDNSIHENNETFTKINSQSSTVTHRQTINQRHSHYITSTSSPKDNLKEDNKGTTGDTSQPSLRDAWTQLQTAVMAKITFGLVSTFASTSQQTVIICVVVFLILCFLYFVIRSYYNSSTFERDMAK